MRCLQKLQGLTPIRQVITREKTGNMRWTQRDGLVESTCVVVDTDGSALLQTLSLSGVDAKRTVSNDVLEVLEVRWLRVVIAAFMRNVV